MPDPTEPTPIFHGVIEGHPEIVLPDGTWVFAPDTPEPTGQVDLAGWERLGHIDDTGDPQ